MLKTKKSKQNVTILVLSVMLAIAAIFGVTAAWFVSTAGAQGTVTTGTLTVDITVDGTPLKATDKSNAALTITKPNAMPGQTITGAIGFVVGTAGDEGVVLRAQISVTGLDGVTLGDTFTGWEKKGEYYYYGSESSGLNKLNNEDTAALTTTDFKLPESLVSGAYTEGTGYANQGKTITITISVEAAQANTGAISAWDIKTLAA